MSVFLKELFTPFPEWDKFSERPDESYKFFITEKRALSYLRMKMKTSEFYKTLYGFELLNTPNSINDFSNMENLFKTKAKTYYIGRLLTDEQVSKLKCDWIDRCGFLPKVISVQHPLAFHQINGRKDWDAVVELRSPETSGDFLIGGRKYRELYLASDVFVVNEDLKRVWPKVSTVTKQKSPFFSRLFQNHR